MELSIVIPILNEEKNIYLLIEKIKKNLKLKKFEIIFIDDNSSDKSREVIKSLIKDYKFIRYFNRSNKLRDLSKSCSLGISKSKFKNILIMDADLQHHPKYIPKMIKKMIKHSSDLVICNRKFYKRDKVYGLNFLRYITSILLIYLFNFISKTKTTDPMSGYFLFKKEIYEKSKNKMFMSGYKFLADLLANSHKQLNISHIFIDFYKRNDEKTKMNLKVIIILINFLISVFVSRLKLFKIIF